MISQFLSIERNGFVFIKKWLVGVASEELIYRCGCPLKFGQNSAVHFIRPQHDAPPNTYSGIYGLNEFPFHSDMAYWRIPPRYLMLRCVKGHAGVATLLIKGDEIVERVGKGKLVRALVKPRRPVKGSLPLLSMFRPEAASRRFLLRWDEKFIVPASTGSAETVASTNRAILEATKVSVSLSEPGDTLWIDNWRMLHGRSAVAVNYADRLIERAYLGELY